MRVTRTTVPIAHTWHITKATKPNPHQTVVTKVMKTNLHEPCNHDQHSTNILRHITITVLTNPQTKPSHEPLQVTRSMSNRLCDMSFEF